MRAELLAPSGVFDPVALERARSWLAERSIETVAASETLARHRTYAGFPEGRACSFQTAMGGVTDWVWCIRGGSGAMQILPHVDWEDGKTCQQLLVGCSDATALLNTLAHRTGCPGLHGPMVHRLPDFPDSESIERLLELVMSVEPAPPLRGIHHGPPKAQGRSMGGNLTVLTAMVGTPWMPDLRGAIVFLEDVNEEAYRLERSLDQLLLSGALEGVAGFALGEFPNCSVPEGAEWTLEEMLLDKLGDKVPVITGLPFGHGPRNLAFPIGVACSMEAGQVSFLEPHRR